MSNEKKSKSAITLPALVFIVFLVLKLAEIGTVAHWSWWWVTSPLWIPLAISFVLFLIILVIKAIIE